MDERKSGAHSEFGGVKEHLSKYHVCRFYHHPISQVRKIEAPTASATCPSPRSHSVVEQEPAFRVPHAEGPLNGPLVLHTLKTSRGAGCP